MYKGEWERSKRHGHGLFSFSSGVSYEGQWINDMQSGLGVFTWPDGTKLEAEWRNGRPLSGGVFSAPDGNMVDNVEYGGVLKQFFESSLTSEGWADALLTVGRAVLHRRQRVASPGPSVGGLIGSLHSDQNRERMSLSESALTAITDWVTISQLGLGSYGIVLKCLDLCSGFLFAAKQASWQKCLLLALCCASDVTSISAPLSPAGLFTGPCLSLGCRGRCCPLPRSKRASEGAEHPQGPVPPQHCYVPWKSSMGPA